eukprot:356079_1
MTTLNDVVSQFELKLGHPPYQISQLLSYCRQNNLPFKYSQIHAWWPNRPKTTLKPTESPINAYMDRLDDILHIITIAYIRQIIQPLLNKNTVIPKDVSNTIYKFYELNQYRLIFIQKENIFNPLYYCISMNSDKIKMIPSSNNQSNSFVEDRTSDISYCGIYNINTKYLSITTNQSKHKNIRLNGVFECGGGCQNRHNRYIFKYSSMVTLVLYKHSDLQRIILDNNNSSNNLQIEVFTKRICNLPVSGNCSTTYHPKHGLIVASDNKETLDMGFLAPNPNHIQKYFQLIEIDNTLKWNSIYNEYNLKGNSSIIIVNKGNDLFVCGNSGVGMYNFETNSWKKLQEMVISVEYQRPILCYDRLKKYIYCFVTASNNNKEIYYFDLNLYKWVVHSIIISILKYRNNFPR